MFGVFGSTEISQSSGLASEIEESDLLSLSSKVYNLSFDLMLCSDDIFCVMTCCDIINVKF